ncbi:hypothetical protein L7F22_048112 [Adiantum nelumboides]|nr:hypothetical protein [Adiantum nelumboides]
MASMVAMIGLPPSGGLHCNLASHRHALVACLPASLAQDVAAKFHLQAASLHIKTSIRRVPQQAVSDAASLSQADIEMFESSDDKALPIPVVIIDQDSDPDATVVELSFGNKLGALLDTMQALKELGLNVERSRITVEGPVTRKRFAITRADNGRKIEDPELLEAIRLTIINNMIEYHPEASSLLAMGNAFGIQAPTKLDVDIATHIRITDEGPHESLLYIETADRPGLLREIVKVIAEINVGFRSGEFDTEGLVAKAKFHCSYRGAALSKSMKQVLTNCFQYYLRRPETNVDSY